MSKELSQEIKEIFNDKDFHFNHILRELATQFGPSATVHDIAKEYYGHVLPVKQINGKKYTAGYGGPTMVKAGKHTATLLDVIPQNKQCKLLFAVGSKFIYQNVTDYNQQYLVSVTKDIGKDYIVAVEHEKIETIGDVHAVVSVSTIKE